MERVDVSIEINANLEKVFDAITDHERYGSMIGMRSVKLLKQGEKEKNGKGAIRQFNSPSVTFEEEISEFEKNKYYEYKVLRCYIDVGFMQLDIPLEHKLGRVTFREKDGVVEVNWISVLVVNAPIAEDITTKVFSFFGSASFLFLLHQFKNQLEAN